MVAGNLLQSSYLLPQPRHLVILGGNLIPELIELIVVGHFKVSEAK